MNAGSMFSGPSVPDGAEVGVIVRSASGVTRIRQRAVGGPSVAASTSNSTPEARMSWANTSPSWSALTLPTNPAVPPKLATPTAVLAAEPPEVSMPAPMAPYSRSASSVSTRRIVPLASPSCSRKASSAVAITSTMALPTATTSRSGSDIFLRSAGPLGSGLGQRSLTLVTDDPAFRLPRTVVPKHYRLTLEPDLEAATFVGTVDIEVTINEPVTEVVLNAAELEVIWASVDGLPAKPDLDEVGQRLHLQVDKPVGPGDSVVSISFTGMLNDKLRGFYRSTYADDDGTSHIIATTQFESTDARRAFPCWDEPDLKATFDVTLVVPEELLAVSQLAPWSSEPAGDGRRRVSFATTMKMSTYLVAFVVGRLAVTEPVDVDGTPLRVVMPPRARAPQPTSPSRSAPTLLRYFTDYFGIAYPGDKMDLLAIPDFAVGAMENLGASPSGRPCCWSTRKLPRSTELRAGRRRGRPRDRPHVVRRPRDHALVERHLAERGVRHLHGDARASTPSAPTGTGGRLRHHAVRLPWSSTAGEHPAHRVPGAGSARGAEGMFDS